MPHSIPPLRIVRSLLFTPGHLERLIPKSAASPADCIALDLEDAVPADSKIAARQTIRASLEAGLFAGKTILVRLNAFDSGLTVGDLDGVACQALDGIIYPMTASPDEIRSLDALLSAKEADLGLAAGHFCLVPVLETSAGVLNALPIATASDRVAGLLFGGEDYLADMDARKDPEQWCFYVPRVQVVMAARAAGVTPIDTPYVDVHDAEGFREHARRGRALGMAGVAVMSPSQIPIAHEVYTASEEEIAQARQMLEMLEEIRRAGRGMTVRDGLYISPVGEKKARRILEQAEAIRERERNKNP